MFYSSNVIDKALTCSFCQNKCTDVIKLIPECGNSICAPCSGDLMYQDDARLTYQCKACQQVHAVPEGGLPENKHLQSLLKDKPIGKPLSKNAKKLKDCLEDIYEKLTKLISSDRREIINKHCDQLIKEVNETVGSAVRHLFDIEKDLKKQINEHRTKCLDSIESDTSTIADNSIGDELKVLSDQIDSFGSLWRSQFNSFDVLINETEVESAIDESYNFLSYIHAIEERITQQAFKKQLIRFEPNLVFKESSYYIGCIKTVENSGFIVGYSPQIIKTGHIKAINHVIFHPDGRLISCSEDKSIKIWNAQTQKELFKLNGHLDSVLSLAVLPSGHLASSSMDKTIKIWDLELGKEIRSFQTGVYPVESLRVLKNGNLISCSSFNNQIRIWDPNLKGVKSIFQENPVATMKGHGNEIWGLALFGVLSNNHIVTCTRDKDGYTKSHLQVWDPVGQRKVSSASTNLKCARTLLVLSNDQVALGFQNGTIMIIDLNNFDFTKKRTLAHDISVVSLAELSSGYLISLGTGNYNATIRIWNLDNLSLRETIITGHSNYNLSLCISSDERFLVSHCDEEKVRVWQINK